MARSAALIAGDESRSRTATKQFDIRWTRLDREISVLKHRTEEEWQQIRGGEVQQTAIKEQLWISMRI